ncbi:Fc.00g047950.m01.CDS01 [Cosmosporella sp. VM-42]
MPPKIPAQRISAPEWDAQKEAIRTLFLGENKTLNDTIRCMIETHGFTATKAQYIRKLKTWGMEKKYSQDQWKNAADLVMKRKASGKETILYMGGKTIPSKRLKKELSRYAYLQNNFAAISVARTNDAYPDIIARTPSPCEDRITACCPAQDDVLQVHGNSRIAYGALPQLQYQRSVKTVQLPVYDYLSVSAGTQPKA